MWRAKCSRILLTLFLLVWTTYAQPARRQTELDARVNGLLAKMTLEEKVGQLNLFNVDKTNLGQAIASGKVGSVLNALGAAQTNKLQRLAIERSRLQIPLLFGYDVIHGYRTIFPIPLGLASTWDPGVVETMARMTVASVRRSSDAGLIGFGPPLRFDPVSVRRGRVFRACRKNTKEIQKPLCRPKQERRRNNVFLEFVPFEGKLPNFERIRTDRLILSSWSNSVPPRGSNFCFEGLGMAKESPDFGH
jgi:hypothetical protein